MIDGVPDSSVIVPVTLSGDTFSVNFTPDIILVAAGFGVEMDASAATNSLVDAYDPIQQSFTSTNPSIEFVSAGGDNTQGAVPEPGSMALAGLALAGLALMKSRRGAERASS